MSVIIVQSWARTEVGNIETVTLCEGRKRTECAGRIVALATREEYEAFARDYFGPDVPIDMTGSFWYKVQVD